MKHARKRSYFQIPAGFPFFSLRWFSFHLSHFASHHLSGTCCDYDRHQWRSIPVCCNGNAKACQSICVVLDAWHSMRLLHTLPLMPMYMQLWESARNVLTLRLDNTLPWTTDCRGDHPKLFCFFKRSSQQILPSTSSIFGPNWGLSSRKCDGWPLDEVRWHSTPGGSKQLWCLWPKVCDRFCRIESKECNGSNGNQ